MDYYLGEIRPFAGLRVPAGWHLCDGSYLSVDHDARLFELIGTTYGGNGTSVFRLPDLRSRVLVCAGQGFRPHNYVRGEMSGGERVLLEIADLPAHSHPVTALTKPATTTSPGGAMLATPAGDARFYYYGTEDVKNPSMAAATIGTSGGMDDHDNMMPSLVCNYIIALQGDIPTPETDAAEEG